MSMITTRAEYARPPMPAGRAQRAVVHQMEMRRPAPAIVNNCERIDIAPAAVPVTTRILIADGHEIVRAGLKAILEAHEGWQVVAEASDGKEAINKAMATKPDVAIVEFSLRVMNGIETTRQIRARAPETEVMAFTMHDSDELVGELLLAGVRAFVLKSDDMKYIVAAVESLAAKKPYFTDNLSAKLIGTFLSASGHRAGTTLSARERVIVQLIAEGHSNKEISNVLNISQKTVETHRAAAMRKAGVTSTACLVRYAVRNKLVEP